MTYGSLGIHQKWISYELSNFLTRWLLATFSPSRHLHLVFLDHSMTPSWVDHVLTCLITCHVRITFTTTSCIVHFSRSPFSNLRVILHYNFIKCPFSSWSAPPSLVVGENIWVLSELWAGPILHISPRWSGHYDVHTSHPQPVIRQLPLRTFAWIDSSSVQVHDREQIIQE